VRCEDCAGGQFAGQPLDAANDPTPLPVASAAPAAAGSVT
jgi:hypothetical protein